MRGGERKERERKGASGRGGAAAEIIHSGTQGRAAERAWRRRESGEGR